MSHIILEKLKLLLLLYRNLIVYLRILIHLFLKYIWYLINEIIIFIKIIILKFIPHRLNTLIIINMSFNLRLNQLITIIINFTLFSEILDEGGNVFIEYFIYNPNIISTHFIKIFLKEVSIESLNGSLEYLYYFWLLI